MEIVGRFALGTYALGPGGELSRVHRLVDDRTIRMFHDHIIPGDKLNDQFHIPDDRAVFRVTDFDGRELSLDPGISISISPRASPSAALSAGAPAAP